MARKAGQWEFETAGHITCRVRMKRVIWTEAHLSVSPLYCARDLSLQDDSHNLVASSHLD